MTDVKVLIQIKGGKIIHVSSNDLNLEYVIIDYDNVEQGESPVSQVYGTDSAYEKGKFHELFIDASDPVEMEIKAALKSTHF
jgi:hypothetical protein